MQLMAKNGTNKSKGKIVVCTQSNVAVDVIMSRYLKSYDKFGFKNQEEVIRRILRVSSIDYEPADQDLHKVTFEGHYSNRYPKLTK